MTYQVQNVRSASEHASIQQFAEFDIVDVETGDTAVGKWSAAHPGNAEIYVDGSLVGFLNDLEGADVSAICQQVAAAAGAKNA